MISAPSITTQWRALLNSRGSANVPIWIDCYNVAVASAKVSSFVDYCDAAHIVTQGTPANRAAEPAASANVGGCLTSVVTAGNFYTSTRTAATHAWMQAGGGATIIAGYYTATAANARIASTLIFGAGVGFGFDSVGATAQSSMYVGNGTANPVPNTAFSAALSTPHCLTLRHGTSSSPQWDKRLDGSAIASGSYGAGVSAGTPNNALRMFNRNNASALNFAGEFVFFAAVPYVMSAAELATADAFVRQRYGGLRV